jgi:hypothetical protein
MDSRGSEPKNNQQGEQTSWPRPRTARGGKGKPVFFWGRIRKSIADNIGRYALTGRLPHITNMITVVPSVNGEGSLHYSLQGRKGFVASPCTGEKTCNQTEGSPRAVLYTREKHPDQTRNPNWANPRAGSANGRWVLWYQRIAEVSTFMTIGREQLLLLAHKFIPHCSIENSFSSRFVQVTGVDALCSL